MWPAHWPQGFQSPFFFVAQLRYLDSILSPESKKTKGENIRPVWTQKRLQQSSGDFMEGLSQIGRRTLLDARTKSLIG